MMEILLTLYTSPYHIYKTVLIAKNKLNKSESISQSIPERREPDRMSEYREKKTNEERSSCSGKMSTAKKRSHERDPFSLSKAS